VSNEDVRTTQSGAYAALQKLMAQSPSVTTLQMQLAQGVLGNAGSMSNVAPALVGDQYLVFSLAEREFAVKAEQVQGVERLIDLTPLPNVVPWVRGVINLRGTIASVVDLRMFLGLEPLPYTSRTRLLSLQHNDMVICMIVDGVSEMILFPPSLISVGNTRLASIPLWASQYTIGCAVLSNRVMVILDVPRLLFSEKMQNYGVL
jgi:purine-binding chemotaxis protein CheW